MPPLRRQSRIGDHRALDSIQRRGMVRDGLWWKKVQRRRRRQSGQACHGNKGSWEQRERFGKQGNDEQRGGFQRVEREQGKKAREEKIMPIGEAGRTTASTFSSSR